MFIYIILYIFLLFNLLYSNNKPLFYIGSLLLILLIGLRGAEVGVDTHAYISIFSYINSNGYSGYPEPLFGYMNLSFSKLGFGYLIFQLFVSFATIATICIVIIKHSVNINLSIFLLLVLYFVFYSMNVSRQILACAIIMYSYTKLYNNKIVQFITIVFTATLIHFSAIFSLGALVIKKIYVTKQRSFIFMISSLCVGFILNDSIFKTLLGPYAGYLSTDGSGVRDDGRMMLSITLVLFWNALAFFVITTSKKSLLNEFWCKIYLMGIIVNNLTFKLELGLRIVMYFSIVQIIFYTLYVKNNRIKQQWLPALVIVIFVSTFFWVFLLNNSAKVVPYYITFTSSVQ